MNEREACRTAPVSAIIPCYNCEQTLRRAFESVLLQTLRPAQVVLVDDASQDATKKILADLQLQYPHWVIVHFMDCNRGPSAARNLAWNLASQPYIAFLDADDTWHPRKIEIQYKWMRQHPEAAMLGHLCTQYHAGNDPELSLTEPGCRTFGVEELIFSNPFSTPSVMLKKSIELRFPEGKRYCEDYHLWLLIAAHCGPVQRLEVVLAWYHKPPYGATGLSGALWRMEKGEIGAIAVMYRQRKISKLLFAVAIPFSLAKYALRILKAACGNSALRRTSKLTSHRVRT